MALHTLEQILGDDKFQRHIKRLAPQGLLGYTVNSCNNKGHRLLLLASGIKSLRAVKMLVEAGVDVNTQCECGLTPLLVACSLHKGNLSLAVDVINFLVKNGADTKAKDACGYTAIDMLLKTVPTNSKIEGLSYLFNQSSLDIISQQCKYSDKPSALGYLIQAGHSDLASHVNNRIGKSQHSTLDYRRLALSKLLLLKDFPALFVKKMILPWGHYESGIMDLSKPVMWGLLAITIAATTRSKGHTEFVRQYIACSAPRHSKGQNYRLPLLAPADAHQLTDYTHPLLAAIQNLNYECALAILKSNTQFALPHGLLFHGKGGSKEVATWVSFILDHPLHPEEDKDEFIKSSSPRATSKLSQRWFLLLQELVDRGFGDYDKNNLNVLSPITNLILKSEIFDDHLDDLIKLFQNAPNLIRMSPLDYDRIVHKCKHMSRLVTFVNTGLITSEGLALGIQRSYESKISRMQH